MGAQDATLGVQYGTTSSSVHNSDPLPLPLLRFYCFNPLANPLDMDVLAEFVQVVVSMTASHLSLTRNLDTIPAASIDLLTVASHVVL